MGWLHGEEEEDAYQTDRTVSSETQEEKEARKRRGQEQSRSERRRIEQFIDLINSAEIWLKLGDAYMLLEPITKEKTFLSDVFSEDGCLDGWKERTGSYRSWIDVQIPREDWKMIWRIPVPLQIDFFYSVKESIRADGYKFADDPLEQPWLLKPDFEIRVNKRYGK